MKYFVISDIHGSSLYLKKALEAFELEKADQILILGDILYHGPRNDLPLGYAPKEVIPMLNPLKDKILAVRGNCDAEVDQMVLDFKITDDYKIIDLGFKKIFMTHGHIYNVNKMPPIEEGDIMLHGHTHIPSWTSYGNNNLYLNPGSITIPKENSFHSYMIIEDHKVLWKDLDGNIYHEENI